MKNIKLVKVVSLIMCCVVALSACSMPGKSDSGDSSSKASDSSASADNNDGEALNLDELDEEDVVAQGDNVKWPDKDVPKELKLDANCTAVVKDDESNTIVIPFEDFSEKKATAYIENLKKLGYKAQMEATTADGMLFSGIKDNKEFVTFSYDTPSKEGVILYQPEATGTDINSMLGNLSGDVFEESPEEIDMTDKDKWPEDFISGVPELEGKITEVTNNNNEYVNVYLDYVEKEDFEDYIDILKDNGYTEESNIYTATDYIEYSAYNADGEYVRVYLTIYEDYNSASIEMQVASE